LFGVCERWGGEGAELITGTVFVNDSGPLPALRDNPDVPEILFEGGFAAEKDN
jgi:hypothetical protein